MSRDENSAKNDHHSVLSVRACVSHAESRYILDCHDFVACSDCGDHSLSISTLTNLQHDDGACASIFAFDEWERMLDLSKEESTDGRCIVPSSLCMLTRTSLCMLTMLRSYSVLLFLFHMKETVQSSQRGDCHVNEATFLSFKGRSTNPDAISITSS